jgi:hypothetical protein
MSYGPSGNALGIQAGYGAFFDYVGVYGSVEYNITYPTQSNFGLQMKLGPVAPQIKVYPAVPARDFFWEIYKGINNLQYQNPMFSPY